MNAPLRRADIPADHTWKLEDLFPTPAAWSAELESLPAAAEAIARQAGKLGTASALMACLDAREQLFVRLQHASAYAHLWKSSDGSDPANQAAASRADAVEAQVLAALSFIDPEILALPEGTVQRFLQELPTLAAHGVELEDLMDLRPHTLSPETEQTLAALGQVLDAPLTVYERAKMGDLRFAPFHDAQGREHPNAYNLYESVYDGHPDTALRRAAWQSFCAGLTPYLNTFAATIATEVAKNVVLAKARGYASAEHYLLHRQKVPHALYTTVLDRLRTGIAQPMRRYARLRQRVLGLDQMLFCDIKAPLDPGYAPSVTFDEARSLILEAVAPMGTDYQAIVSSAFAQRWIDRADNVGKSSGAFCASPYRVHPFILITWADAMRNVFVLAHELGHGAHFTLAGRAQSFMNTRCTLPFVEAPSIMNEVLLARHVLSRSSDPRMRRWVIMQVLGTYHHNFVTHLLEAALQRQLYAVAEAGQAITAKTLNESKRAILQDFWGDAVHIDDGAAMTWMRQPHYYLGLYPYTYSVGLVVATAVAQRAAAEGDQVFTGWLDVLRAGGTLPPLELAKMAGIDLTSHAPFDSAIAYVDQLVGELEAGF